MDPSILPSRILAQISAVYSSWTRKSQLVRICSAALGAGACAITALILVRRRKLRLDSSQLSTSSLEVQGKRCAKCGSEAFLDAASKEGINALCCPQCQCSGAINGSEGTVDLDTFGSQVFFQIGPFSECNFLELLQEEVAWEQHDDLLADGNIVTQPRLISYQASDPTFTYTYPGITRELEAKPFTPTINLIRQEVERLTCETFNSAHMNLYRSGRDHLSWHTDEDVPLYGTSPCIASVSFGAQRKFVMRKMLGEPYAESWVPTVPSQMVAYNLSSGSLLVMRGSTQQHWEHSVMKAAELSTGPRINITFRKVIKP